jgi:hypothetical protein
MYTSDCNIHVNSHAPDGYLCADNAPPARCAGSAAGLAPLDGGGSTHGASANGGDHAYGRELLGTAHGNGDSVDMMAGHTHVSSPSKHTAASASPGTIHLQSHPVTGHSNSHTSAKNCCCSYTRAKLLLLIRTHACCLSARLLLTRTVVANLLLLCYSHARAKLLLLTRMSSTCGMYCHIFNRRRRPGAAAATKNAAATAICK